MQLRQLKSARRWHKENSLMPGHFVVSSAREHESCKLGERKKSEGYATNERREKLDTRRKGCVKHQSFASKNCRTSMKLRRMPYKPSNLGFGKRSMQR